MRAAQRTIRVVECLAPSVLDEASNAYEVGREIGLQLGAERERREWEARMKALLEVADAAIDGADATGDADEPVELSADEHATFAELTFELRVRQLLEDDSDDD